MLTIKAEIQQDKQRSDGTYNVKMRFTLDRKVKRLSTNLFVPPTRHYKSFKFKENTPIKKEIDSLVLHSEEHRRKFTTERAGFQVVKDPADKSKLGIVNNINRRVASLCFGQTKTDLQSSCCSAKSNHIRAFAKLSFLYLPGETPFSFVNTLTKWGISLNPTR